MSEALAHRFTAEQYHVLSEQGILAPGARVELLDGLIADLYPEGPEHDEVVAWLAARLEKASSGRYTTLARRAIHLGTLYEPLPDLVLLKPALHGYQTILPRAPDVHLLIEVADESLVFDRTRKLPAYAAREIPEVWVVNLPCLMVEVYREPDGLSYLQRKAVGPGHDVRPLAFPDVGIDTPEIFAATPVGGRLPARV